MNCSTSYSSREREGRLVSWWPSEGSLVSQKAAEELTQLRHYVPSNPKWTQETFKLDGRMLGSGDSVLVLMHVTFLAHLLTVCSLATQTLSASGGSGSQDHAFYQYILTCTGLAWRPQIICSGLGSAPTATAHAQNVLHSENKYVQKKISTCRRSTVLWRHVQGNEMYMLNVRSGKWPPKGNSFANTVRSWEYTSRVQMKVIMRWKYMDFRIHT